MPTENNSTGNPSAKQEKVFDTYHNLMKKRDGLFFFMITKCHLYFLNDWPAVGLLSHLISVSNMRMSGINKADLEQMKRHECWYQAMSKDLQHEVRMKKDKFKAALTRLTDTGLVEVKYGRHFHMWVRVNLLKIWQIETDFLNEGDQSGTQQTPVVETEQEENPPARKNSSERVFRSQQEDFPPAYPNKNLNKSSEDKERADARHPSVDSVNGDTLQRSKSNPPNTVGKYTEAFLQEKAYQLFELTKSTKSSQRQYLNELRSALRNKKYLTEQITAALAVATEFYSDPTSLIPKPTSPHHFVASLPNLLEEVNKRNEEKLQEEESPLSQESIDNILRNCTDVTFPDKKALISFIKRSAANFSAFLTKFHKIKERIASGKLKLNDEEQQADLERFIRYAAVEVSYGIEYEMEKWVHEAYKRTVEWDDWTGGFKHVIWSIGQKQIKQRMKKWSVESTNNQSGYEAFLSVW